MLRRLDFRYRRLLIGQYCRFPERKRSALYHQAVPGGAVEDYGLCRVGGCRSARSGRRSPTAHQRPPFIQKKS